MTPKIDTGGMVAKKRKKKPRIEFTCHGFEKMPKRTQRAMVAMIKALYAMVEKRRRESQG